MPFFPPSIHLTPSPTWSPLGGHSCLRLPGLTVMLPLPAVLHTEFAKAALTHLLPCTDLICVPRPPWLDHTLLGIVEDTTLASIFSPQYSELEEWICTERVCLVKFYNFLDLWQTLWLVHFLQGKNKAEPTVLCEITGFPLGGIEQGRGCRDWPWEEENLRLRRQSGSGCLAEATPPGNPGMPGLHSWCNMSEHWTRSCGPTAMPASRMSQKKPWGSLELPSSLHFPFHGISLCTILSERAWHKQGPALSRPWNKGMNGQPSLQEEGKFHPSPRWESGWAVEDELLCLIKKINRSNSMIYKA